MSLPSTFKSSPLIIASLAATSTGTIICPGHSRPVPDIHFSNILYENPNHDHHDNSHENTDTIANSNSTHNISTTNPYYLLLSSCLDNKSMIRDGLSGDWIGTFIGHKGAVWCSRLNSNGTRAGTGSADFSAKLWDATTGQQLHTFQHQHIVKSVTFSNDDTHLYTGGYEKKLRSYDLNAYDNEPTVIVDNYNSSIQNVIPLPDSNLLAVNGNTNYIHIYDIRTNTAIRTINTLSSITSMQLSLHKNSIVASAGQDVLLYDIHNFNELQKLTLERPIDCVAYNDELQRYVTGSNTELWVRVYDSTGNEIGINKGHHGPARCVAFAPHGYTYASGSEDGTIRLWKFNDFSLPDNDIQHIDSKLRDTSVNQQDTSNQQNDMKTNGVSVTT